MKRLMKGLCHALYEPAIHRLSYLYPFLEQIRLHAQYCGTVFWNIPGEKCPLRHPAMTFSVIPSRHSISVLPAHRRRWVFSVSVVRYCDALSYDIFGSLLVETFKTPLTLTPPLPHSPQYTQLNQSLPKTFRWTITYAENYGHPFSFRVTFMINLGLIRVTIKERLCC